MQTKLTTLQSEHRKGQARLAELQRETNEIRETMLRIEGAIMVLKELMKEDTTNQEQVVSKNFNNKITP